MTWQLFWQVHEMFFMKQKMTFRDSEPYAVYKRKMMKNTILVLLTYSCIAVPLSGQHASPESAKLITPEGVKAFTLTRGIAVTTVGTVNGTRTEADTGFGLTDGFSCWLKFTLTDTHEIRFTLHSLETRALFPKTPPGVYLPFVVYRFDGSGKQLSAALRSGSVQPVRAGMLWGCAINNFLREGGLSPFETDTFAKGPWQSGFVKTLSGAPGSQYYVCIAMAVEMKAKLAIDNRF
ncbi:MAG TPA: hypothetical protein VI461_17430, partial [Chitinophagaceae bacterium]|nr:hypothetical protein [Chitinophagaceae bacterium]